MSVQFKNNSVAVKDALNDACIAFLYEAAGELEAETKRNSRPIKYGRHDVRGNWKYTVDEAKGEARVGNPLEASYWEELGKKFLCRV